MMAATQPFLSGAISKTVNLPKDATIEDVQDIYEQGWRLGLKAVALYRDGCKASQPLSATGEKSEKAEKKAETLAAERARRPAAHRIRSWRRCRCGTADQAQLSLQMAPNTRMYGQRIRLPKRRAGYTQEARVGGHKIFLRTGEYENGTLGEIFIDMHKEGAAFRSLMNCFAMSVSVGLQYGVPLQTYVDQFTFTRFEPQGPVEGHPYVKFATSIVDFIFRVARRRVPAPPRPGAHQAGDRLVAARRRVAPGNASGAAEPAADSGHSRARQQAAAAHARSHSA